jgi:hypothetical protein
MRSATRPGSRNEATSNVGAASRHSVMPLHDLASQRKQTLHSGILVCVGASLERLIGPPRSRRRSAFIVGVFAFWVVWMATGALIGTAIGFTSDGVANALLGAFAAAVLWILVFSVL